MKRGDLILRVERTGELIAVNPDCLERGIGDTHARPDGYLDEPGVPVTLILVGTCGMEAGT